MISQLISPLISQNLPQKATPIFFSQLMSLLPHQYWSHKSHHHGVKSSAAKHPTPPDATKAADS
jgi:hypothetical protein